MIDFEITKVIVKAKPAEVVTDIGTIYIDNPLEGWTVEPAEAMECMWNEDSFEELEKDIIADVERTRND